MHPISDGDAFRVAVLTISDAAAAGVRADLSGPIAVSWASARGASVVDSAIVPDDALAITRRLLRWCDDDMADLVLTTGGTGLSPRDVTPEATRTLVEREAPGIAELIRLRALEQGVERAALSRGIAGVRGRTLVVNLPGSPAGVKDALAALDPIIAHAIAVLRDRATDHSAGGSGAPDPRPPSPDAS